MKKYGKRADDGSKLDPITRGGRAFAALGLPADANCRLPIITITGSSYVKTEHHTGVLQLGERCVRLYSRLGVIRIEGCGLAASEMDSDTIIIDGAVKSVMFE